MKDLKKFILESAKDLYQNLMDNFFCGVYELDEPEDPDAVENLENIIKDFVKDAKSLQIESSVANDYWADFDIKCKQNNKVEKEVEDLPDNSDWCEMDVFSLRVDGNVLYMSSQTGAAQNGDYFDLKITKK